jgi:hypothetical protein
MAKDLPKMRKLVLWGRMTKLHLQMSLKSLTTTAELHFILDRQMRSCDDGTS